MIDTEVRGEDRQCVTADSKLEPQCRPHRGKRM